MRLTTAIAILSFSPSSEAIYLACCQTTQSCPEHYNTIDTFAKERETFNACCYPDEQPDPSGLPECVHPIVTENGVGISVMSLPQPKLENVTSPQLLEEVTITEGNEEIFIKVTTIAEPTNAEESDVVPYKCCSVTSTVKPVLRQSEKEAHSCPSNMHAVEGLSSLFLRLALSEYNNRDVFVCCDAETLVNDVDTTLVNPCSSEVTQGGQDSVTAADNQKHENEKTEEDIIAQENKEESVANNEQVEDYTTVETNTAAVEVTSENDGSNSASTVSTAAFGVAVFCVAFEALV